MNQFQATANQGGMFSPSANNLPPQHANYMATQNTSVDSSDGSPKEHAVDSKNGLTRPADFWKRYDRLADSHDRKMSQNLNANLDVLLIFAALFSAINTAFIGLTMSTLSPDPLNKTNKLLELLVMHADNNTLTSSDLSPPFSPGVPSIVTNCFLYASLCCSLLAAMGAMIGKEWLQSFDRSGQTGPSEEQGLFRQSKFNGVQQWHLETIILFLPNLLLFSVTLFFTGLAIFLFSIEKAVSLIVIAFEGFAVVMWSSTTIAGALQPLCPYQTAASRALRRLFHFAKACWKYVRRVDLRRFGVVVSRIPHGIIATLRKYQWRRTSKTQSPASGIRPKEQPANLHLLNKYRRREDHDQHRASAQAACWLLEAASNREDQLAAVYFMRTLDLAGCSSMVQDFERWRHLLLRTQVAFDLWQYQPTEKHREEAEIYGRAVCHILLQCSETDGKWGAINDMKYRRTGGLGRNFLEGFKSASEYLTADDADEFAMQVALLHALAITDDKPIDAYRWSKLRKLVTELYPDSDILISLSAVLMYKGFGGFCDKSEPIHEDFDRIEWNGRARDAYKREQFGKNLVLALASTVHAIKPVAGSQWRPEMVEICTIYIRMARNLTESIGTGSSYLEWLGKSVAELMVQVDQSKIWDPLDAHWAEFSVEAVLSLQALNSKNLRQLINSSPAPILPGLWRAFDIITIALKSTNGPIQGLGPNFILDALEWLSNSISDDDPMSGLEGDHAVLLYIASGLSDKAPRRRQRWLQLFLHNRRRWFEQASKLLCRRWLDVGLGGHLLEVFERPMTWGKSETGIVDILESTLRGPSNFGLYLLGSAPFITACAGVIAYLDEMRESAYNNWRVILRRVLEILLVLWRCTSDMPGLGVNLAPETMVPALRGATGLLNWEMTHQEARQKPRYADELCNFIMVLKRNLPISTLISRNVDIAVNNLQGQLPTQLRARLGWKYHLYEVTKAPTLCSRPSYLDNGIM